MVITVLFVLVFCFVLIGFTPNVGLELDPKIKSCMLLKTEPVRCPYCGALMMLFSFPQFFCGLFFF